MGLLRLLGLRTAGKQAAPAPVQAPPTDWKAQGNAALAESDLARAADCYRHAADVDPRDAAAWLNLGYCLLETGDPAAAGAALDRSLALAEVGASYLHDVHYLRGRALAAQGQWALARRAFELALAARADFTEARLGLANAFLELGELEAALDWAGKAQEAGLPAAMLQAQAAARLKRFDEALSVLDTVLEQHPGNAAAWHTKGTVLLEAGKSAAALEAFQRSVTLAGPWPEILVNMATALNALGRPEEALSHARQALQLDPSNGFAMYMTGLTLLETLRVDEAVDFCGKAFALAPKGPDLEWNHAIANLLAGRLQAGWPAYECRLDAPGGYYQKRPLPANVRVWRGESLQGRSILLEAEQGLGDTLMMLRYLPMVAERAAKVWVRVQPSLLELARQVAPGCQFVADEALPLPDFVCPLMSLPRAFATTLETIPGAVPYLHADPARVAAWRSELASLPGRLKIGVAWSGNPVHANDARRSMPLGALRQLAGDEDAFVTVQPNIPEPALAEWPQLHRCGDRVRDFSDTAALFDSLDLVISVDTSVVHLAGALGRPVFLLLAHYPDWRWMVGRADSPWYPSLKLYRQPAPGDWAAVVAQVRRDLSTFEPR